ncbi:MAG: O-antigen ligase family protein [Endomicrobiia bacterium]|nr:O-antigen ligase family protein [Endomicrobiia bacterium]
MSPPIENKLLPSARAACLAILFIVTLAPVNFISIKIFGAPFHHVFIGGAVMALGLAAWLCDKELDDFDLWLLLVAGGFSMSMITSVAAGNTSRSVASFAVRGLAVAFIAKRLFSGALEKASAAILICATLLATIGLVEFFFQWNPFFRMKELFFDYWRLNFSLTPRSGMAASIGHPVPFAACLALALPTAAYVAVSSKNLIYSAPFGIISAAIIFSFSRSSWIAAAVACAFFAVHAGYRINFRRLLIVFFAVGALVLLALPSTKIVYAERLSLRRIKQEIISSHRTAAYKTTYNVLKIYPFFGIGFGNYPKVHETYRDAGGVESLETTDNVYLRFLCETGVVGSLIFAAFALYWFRRIWLARDNLPLYAILAGLLGFMVNQAAADLFYWTAPQFLFWFSLGAAVAAAKGSVK